MWAAKLLMGTLARLFMLRGGIVFGTLLIVCAQETGRAEPQPGMSPSPKLANEEMPEPVKVPADPLAGYLIARWGSSFSDVQRNFAAKGASNYKESHVSEAEWNRMTIGVELTNHFAGWGVPVRPPFSSFSFKDETGEKTFLFHRDRFYAATNLSDEDWTRKRGVELLAAMCEKYGRAILKATADSVTAVWETEAGFVHTQLAPLNYKLPSGIHPLAENKLRLVVPPLHLDCHIKRIDVGYGPSNLNRNTPLVLRQEADENLSKLRENVTLPFVPANPAKGKYLVVIFHVEWREPEGSVEQDTQQEANTITSFLRSNTVAIDPSNNKVKAVFAFIQQDIGVVLFFDVPIDAGRMILQINASQIVRRWTGPNDSEGHDVELPGPQLIDLEQTALPWGVPDAITEKEVEKYHINVSGNITYGSKLICKEIQDANNADKAKKDQQQKQEEKKHQKALEERF